MIRVEKNKPDSGKYIDRTRGKEYNNIVTAVVFLPKTEENEMTKKEEREVLQQGLNLYSGILFHNQKFSDGKEDEIRYRFDCPEFATLREKYDLEKIAGKGSAFRKAKRLLHYFAPRLAHSSWFDNSVACNALELLEYSLNRPEQGINCLCKSKILQECCLALGIYARRVCIMPYSPYDFDNHVVTEIYDGKLKKWIMLDPTSDGFFVDEHKTPLSLLEIRRRFAEDEFVTFVSSAERTSDLRKLREKHIDQNAYLCKNLFFFYIDRDSEFGATGEVLAFVPENYSIKENSIANMRYRINHLPEEYLSFKEDLEKKAEELKTIDEYERTKIEAMTRPPVSAPVKVRLKK